MAIELNKVYCMDALELLKQLPDESVDLVLIDPPYPDYYVEEYKYNEELIKKVLSNFNCRQLIFWSAKAEFPLDYSAIHIWDKKTGCGSQYERIFERNGGKEYRVFRCYLINSSVAKSYHGLGEEFTGHPSQKPIKLMREIIKKYSKKGDLIIDLFCGTGVIPLVCKQLGRNFIACDNCQEYVDIANKRLAQEVLI